MKRSGDGGKSAPRTPANAPRSANAANASTPEVGSERLQKILARAGVASRRAAEEMIAAGRVKVNGQVVTEMGTRATPSTDKIEVDGRPISIAPTGQKAREYVYIMLNKPLSVVSTAKDTHGRPTVLDLVRPTADGGRRTKDEGQQTSEGRKSTLRTPHSAFRIFPVGRLDADSTGLILLTNDGELTFRLTHPRFGVEKEYRVLVRGTPNEETLQKLREGVEIEGDLTALAKVEARGKHSGNTWLRVVIHEGRKRQVRLMTAAVGHPVIELQRVRFGPLALGGLLPGQWRYLATHEVHALRKAVKLPM